MAQTFTDFMQQRGFVRVEDEADRLHYCPSWSSTWRLGGTRLEMCQYSLGIDKDRVTFFDPCAPEFTVCALITDEGGRGQGNASRALNAFIEACRMVGVTDIYLEPCAMTKHDPVLDADTLTAWYRRYGFEVVAETRGRIMSITLMTNLEDVA